MTAFLRARLPHDHSWELAYRVLLSASFIAVLVYPLVLASGKISSYVFEPSGEWRSPAEIDQQFRENFPLRGRARRIMSRLPLGQLPNNVVRGKDDWLFYRAEISGDGHVLDDLAGQLTPSPAALVQWRAVMAKRQAEVEQAGGVFLAVVAPNKETIYSDRLPLRYRAVGHAKSRMDWVAEALPDSLLMDLRPVLRQARRSEAPRSVYFATDTHWNPLGALAAYRAVVDRLRTRFPTLVPLAESDFQVIPQERVGDLTNMAGKKTVESTFFLSPKKPLSARCPDIRQVLLAENGTSCQPTLNEHFITTQDRDDLPTAVVFHDSFMVFMLPYLAQNFRRVVFMWGKYDAALVAQEKPDVVLQESVERYLPHLFQTKESP